jgi:hypothetical protein
MHVKAYALIFQPVLLREWLVFHTELVSSFLHHSARPAVREYAAPSD